jgi:hypothetical protein
VPIPAKFNAILDVTESCEIYVYALQLLISVSFFQQNNASSTLPVAVNKQYNTPINMYSVNNVMDTLAHQTAGVNLGCVCLPSNKSALHLTPPFSSTDPQVVRMQVNRMRVKSPRSLENTCMFKTHTDPKPKEESHKAHSNPQVQSRSFKALQQMIDSGEGVYVGSYILLISKIITIALSYKKKGKNLKLQWLVR